VRAKLTDRRFKAFLPEKPISHQVHPKWLKFIGYVGAAVERL
jgi:hypothetical protein